MARAMFSAFHKEIFDRANLSIAGGALTNSKRPSCFVEGVYPTHLAKGKGCFVWDTKGNKYIDFICALGTSILGYANEEVDNAAIEEIRKGNLLSLGTELEIEVAEKIKSLFPFVERVRFLKSGSEACTASLTIARAFTKRSAIVNEGYHGWHPEFTSLTPPHFGVLEHPDIFTVQSFPNDREVAARIFEPVMTDYSEERKAWLMKQPRNDGSVLIFDEIITGLRFPRWGVSNHWGIEPELLCLGKAIANGYALSVVAGKRALMEDQEYFVSSTFAGERSALAAAKKTIELLEKKYIIATLWERGAQFLYEFNSLWPEGIQLKGYPTRGVFYAPEQVTRALFFQEACKAGLLFGPSFFLNFEHLPHLDSVLQICKDILLRIRMGQVRLEGKMPQTPYAQRARNSA